MTTDDLKQLRVNILSGVGTVVLLAVATLVLNWLSDGGVIEALGGVTQKRLAQWSPVSPLQTNMGDWKPTCPAGSYVTGLEFTKAAGGSTGYVDFIKITCRPLNTSRLP